MLNQKGFTLIEVMITLGIVAFALVAYLGANYTMDQSAEAAYQKSIAMQDAQQVIEQIRNTSATGTFPDIVTSTYSNGAAVSGYSNLPSEQVYVDYVDPTADPLDVTVRVTYLQNGVRSATHTIRTLVTQRTMAS